MNEPLLLAVAGNPVAHSLSPVLFNRMFELCGHQGRYLRLASSCAQSALSTARELKLWGLNITAPFKKDILEKGVAPDDEARQIGAANFIRFSSGKPCALNTDHVGVTEALQAGGISPLNKKALILGAGPAARAAAWGLKMRGAANVVLLNRSTEKARAAALDLNCTWSPADRLHALLKEMDIIVSCIPGSPFRRLIPKLSPQQVFLDADYSADEAPGDSPPDQAHVISGREWLFHQALPVMSILSGKTLSAETKALIHREMSLSRNSGRKHIVLTGMSGTGKTTIGMILARMTGLDFRDSDTEIEKAAGKTVREIFPLEGESGFRIREKNALEKIIHTEEPGIISLGGGAVLDSDIRTWLKRKCFVIWIWTSAAEAVRRIAASYQRPLISGARPENDYREILKQRKQLYAEVSDIVIQSDDGKCEEIARRIQNEMDNAFGN